MTTTGRPRVLVFEPEHLGHQPGFVRALAAWLGRHAVPFDVSFLVGEPLLARLREDHAAGLAGPAGTEVRVLTDGELQACTAGSLRTKAMARWRVLQRHLRLSGATHGHALFLDPFQLPLALGMRLGSGHTLSGILFRPSVHYSQASGTRAPWRERWRDALKRRLYLRMLHNPDLRLVLTLDPYFPAYARQAFESGHKVVALPDPVLGEASGVGAVADDVRAALQAGRATFLLFGALDARKGVPATLRALARVPAEARRGLRVVLAGRLDADCRARVAELTAGLRDADRDSQSLCVVDRFLTTAELDWLVARSDVVLAPYHRHVGSSGALIWAARHGKPVLAQDYGLIGALVRDYRLGVTADTTDPAAIAVAMQRLVDPATRAALAQSARWADFLAGRAADDFAQQLYAAVGEAM